MRENDGHDPEHGHRATKLALDLAALLDLADDSLRLLIEACELHDRGLVSHDPTIGAAWDADRLDLVRVGKVPDPRFFSTPAGQRRAVELAPAR